MKRAVETYRSSNEAIDRKEKRNSGDKVAYVFLILRGKAFMDSQSADGIAS
jgi:hypothetical protein